MESDRIKWNQRYSGEEFYFSLGPSKFLGEVFETIRPLVKGKRALDIACGEGRNALFLARHGFEVTAVDIAERGLERGRKRAAELGVEVDFVRADLEQYRLEDRYDVILDFNFLLRPLIPAMIESLTPGGVIVMETILDAPNLQGEHRGEFLLQPGELERLFTRPEGTMLLVQEDTAQATPVARVLFRKNLPD